jgi:hypothetical protein
LKLEGGGFEAMNSLRYGIFYSESAGSLDSTTVGYAWNGSEDHNYGYLFIPTSGDNVPESWQGVTTESGTFGAVVDRPWLSSNGDKNYVLGSNLQQPEKAVGSAGTYDFEISIAHSGAVNEVKYSLSKDGYSWSGQKIDDYSPVTTTKFNSLAFAVRGGTAATTLNLTDVQVDLQDYIVGVEDTEERTLPTEFALGQNYPNPFNPTTTIKFALPKNSDVKIIVFDVLGRAVSTLVDRNFDAGNHKVSFNASNLSSGVYFYRIEAGDFTQVKKLMLLK